MKKTIVVSIFAGMVLPPIIFWAVFMRTPSVSHEQAKAWMRDSRKDTILIDVRPKSEFDEFSLIEAVNIPLSVMASDPKGKWTGTLEGKKHILLICDSGILSADATERLLRMGFANALNVEKGMDAWLSFREKGSAFEIPRVKIPECETDGVRRVQLTLFEKVLICVTAFGIKPLYELVSLILAILLWKETDPDLAALRRAMIAFFIGENGCAANYLLYNDQSLFMEYLHMYGMLLCFGFASYALMKAMDMRVIQFTDARAKCALLPLCKKCYKYQSVSCNMRLLFLFVIPATAILAFMPLSADFLRFFTIGDVFGEDVIFGHIIMYQFLEIRIFPLVSLCFFIPSFFILLFRKEAGIEISKILFAMGLGNVSFGIMRFMLYWGYYRNSLWADAWEEISECLFIGFVLWVIVRVRMVGRDSCANKRS